MPLIYPDDWHEALSSIKAKLEDSAIRIVVVGSKNMGKSSFSRFVTAKLLEDGTASVFTLEADCGQPDNTPPGIISLSRRYIHQNEYTRFDLMSQRYLGFVNPAVDPVMYVQRIEEVFADFLSHTSPSFPLLVNCHGFGTGVGRETWEAVIRVVQPHFVVYVGTQETVELTEYSLSLISREYPIPTPSPLSISQVIATEDPDCFHPHQSSGSDYRWIKFADHFRPELKKTLGYRACPPSQFFQYPYTRMLELETARINFKFLATDIPPSDPLRAVICTVAALLAGDEFICLGYIAEATSDHLKVIIPPNILKSRVESIDTVARGSINWSPRDPVMVNGKTTSANIIDQDEPYFLRNVLAGDIGNVRSGRNDLKRRRLTNS